MGLFDVNGKTPVAVWCPSRDTVGNGTSILYDLASSNNGALSNMATPASNWQADIEAGGIRSLSFDGSNDYVSFGTPAILGTTPIVFSFWVNTTSTARAGLITRQDSGGTGWIIDMLTSGAIRVYASRSTGSSQFRQRDTTQTINNGVWRHIVVTIGDSPTIFIDGTEATYTGISSSGSIPTLKTSNVLALASNLPFAFYLSGFIDDVRAFDQLLDGTDIAYLNNSGAGRGRVLGSDFETAGMFGGMSGAMTGGMVL